MKHRLSTWLVTLIGASLALLVTTGSGCNKPSEEECKKAVSNIRQLYQTVKEDVGAPVEGMVRACRGSASKESIQCFIAATNTKELQDCEGGELFAPAPGENKEEKESGGNEGKTDEKDQ